MGAQLASWVGFPVHLASPGPSGRVDQSSSPYEEAIANTIDDVAAPIPSPFRPIPSPSAAKPDRWILPIPQ